MGEKNLPTTGLHEKFFENRINDASESSVEKEWLTTEEAAEYLGISPATMRNLRSDGRIPYYKWQRRNRWEACFSKRRLHP